MRILVPFIGLIVGLSMVSSSSTANTPSNRVAKSHRTEAASHHQPQHNQHQEVHLDSIALGRRGFSIDNNSKRLKLRKRVTPSPNSSGSGTVVGGILGGKSGKPVVIDTNPDPADVPPSPKSKPNPHELGVGPVFDKKVLDVNTPGASTPPRGPPEPVLKLATEQHKLVVATIPNMEKGPLGVGNQKPPPQP